MAPGVWGGLSPPAHLLHEVEEGLEARPPLFLALARPLALQLLADAAHHAVLRPVPLVLLGRQRLAVPPQPLGVLRGGTAAGGHTGTKTPAPQPRPAPPDPPPSR